MHVTSRGTYGYRRVHAELTMAMGVTVSDKTVFTLMHQAGIYGLPGPIRTTLVINALDMAIRNRRPEPGGIVHADHGTQFTSWLFGEKIRSAGLLPSFGSVGDGLDNAMMESFWSSMQIELLDRKKWKTRVELANAIFEYIEIFHNRQRRHSALGHRTPIEYETLNINDIPAAS
ncbi:transposase InsO family protein [Microbacterium trichothecenolyticum]|uniref:Transposase InsO family protein n=1 Tax=Microbacterium trichothecenolyticum TaxID=69370 RepID=A0ABU0TUX6_MICTR|nr:transposase InsO family protein [Microbacterium trichothecenolyticum]